MKIEIKGSGIYGTEVHYTADNVHVREEVYETFYGKDEEGKLKNLGRDVSDEILDKFCSITEGLIYYRKKDFDSVFLVEQLLYKMPAKEKLEIYNQLKEEFDENI